MTAAQKRAGNKKIDKMFMDNGEFYCLVNLPGCNAVPITRAHRHKVRFYNTQLDKFHARDQVIPACLPCHMKIEQDAELTEKIFMKVRGKEK